MNLPDWILAQLDWRGEPGLWLLGSFLLAVLGANVGWLFCKAWGAAAGSPLMRLRHWAGAPWFLLVLRWAYLVGPAYATLLLGVLPARQLGVSGIDWIRATGMDGALAAGALALLVAGWWRYRRGLPAPGANGQQGRLRQPLIMVWAVAALEAAALQLHWAFYRAAIGVLPWLGDGYWACWAGLGVEALQWALDPWFRQELRQSLSAGPIVRRGVLAVVTTALFVVTRNLWLCWIVHALFEGWASSYGEDSA